MIGEGGNTVTRWDMSVDKAKHCYLSGHESREEENNVTGLDLRVEKRDILLPYWT